MIAANPLQFGSIVGDPVYCDIGDPIYCDIGDPMVRLGQSRLVVFRFQLTVGDPIYCDIG